jgi:pSer/pThr/pTyr-binding forkhead associated (FHA) protein
MIWVEILSRQRDVAARFRSTGPEIRIGRGYDNDVVVDDPYVAAQHLRVFRDQSGQLIAEDMGSANGTFLDDGKSRLARIMVDGNHPIRIGRTYLRIREINHAVEQERVARPEWGRLPVALAVTLGLALLVIYAFDVWLAQTTEPRASSYLLPLLTVAAMVLAWVGMWALLSRIFSGRSQFLRNLLIALAGTMAFTLYAEFARVSAFALIWSTASNYLYVAAWSFFAVVCFLHLREVGPARLWVKGGLVTALLATAIAVQTLQRSEAFSDFGRQTTTRLLMPPAFRAVPFQTQNAFFGEVATLKGKLDADRIQVQPEESGR